MSENKRASAHRQRQGPLVQARRREGRRSDHAARQRHPEAGADQLGGNTTAEYAVDNWKNCRRCRRRRASTS